MRAADVSSGVAYHGSHLLASLKKLKRPRNVRENISLNLIINPLKNLKGYRNAV